MTNFKNTLISFISINHGTKDYWRKKFGSSFITEYRKLPVVAQPHYHLYLICSRQCGLEMTKSAAEAAAQLWLKSGRYLNKFYLWLLFLA